MTRIAQVAFLVLSSSALAVGCDHPRPIEPPPIPQIDPDQPVTGGEVKPTPEAAEEEEGVRECPTLDNEGDETSDPVERCPEEDDE